MLTLQEHGEGSSAYARLYTRTYSCASYMYYCLVCCIFNNAVGIHFIYHISETR